MICELKNNHIPYASSFIIYYFWASLGKTYSLICFIMLSLFFISSILPS
jgi:hypothetical protein